MASNSPSPRRLVAFDLDGTVLHNGQPMTARTIAALEAARTAGCLLVVSTGRAWETLPQGLADAPYLDYLSLANGSQLRRAGSGAHVLSRAITGSVADALLGSCPAAWYVFLEDDLFFEWKTVTGHLTNRAYKPSLRVLLRALRSRSLCFNAQKELRRRGLPPVSKLEPIFPDAESRAAALEHIYARGDLEVVTTSGLDLELTAKGVDKGSALTALAERYAISSQHILCFGDSSNDLSMATAGTFVAMGNAADRVKAVAAHVTLPVWEDGVAVFLEQWLKEL